MEEGWYEKHLSDDEAQGVLIRIYTEEFVKRSSDASRQQEGLDLCKKWVARQDWTGRKVLSTEVKKSFMIPTSQGNVPFNYIVDRMELLDSGEVKVVDLKTNSWPVDADDLRFKVQAQAYALAAQIEHPKAPGIIVCFDMMRFEPVEALFTRDENAATWYYLKDLAERILADNKPEERLNDTCRFCVRRFNCDTLTKHAAGGGALAINDLEDAVDRRAALKGATNATKAMVEELDKFILAALEPEGRDVIVTPNNRAKITSRKNRYVSMGEVARGMGASTQKLARFSKLDIKDVDRLLADGNPVLAEGEKDDLRTYIKDGAGRPYLQTSPVKG